MREEPLVIVLYIRSISSRRSVMPIERETFTLEMRIEIHVHWILN